jgi:integrase
MGKVTKRTVDALQPTPGRDVLLWDDELPGFGVRCRPSGTKVYFLKYRVQGSRQRWLTLGPHGILTPIAARAKALHEKAAVAGGADPSAERQKKRREDTVAAVADRYVVEHVMTHNKSTTQAEVRRIVETRIKPGLGVIKISLLTRADVKAWHTSMSATPYEANRALAYMSKMLSLAATDWELRESNPCIGIKRFPERARERFFTDDELSRIGSALASAERHGTELPGFILLVRLLAVTGMRLGEVLKLSWADIDREERAIRLRDAKSGARTVRLGAAAVAILDAVGEQDGYVVHDLDPLQPLSVGSAHRAWSRLCKKAEIFDGRMHDLRHTAGTFAALAGANAFAVRDLLGHRTLAMTSRYVGRAAEMARGAADAMSDRVATALGASTNNHQVPEPSAPAVAYEPADDQTKTAPASAVAIDIRRTQSAQKAEADARANRLFNEAAIDRIINAVGIRHCPQTLQREAMAADLERIARHYSFRDEANDRPPEGEACEWFDGLASDLARVRLRLASPPRNDPDLLHRSMILADVDPDDVGKIRNTFDGISFAKTILDKILQAESYGLGRIGSRLGSPENSWLIGEALPKVFEQHFGQPCGMARDKSTKKPSSPGIRFIVEVLSIIGVVTRDCVSFTPGAVEYYIRRARR